MKRLSFRAKCGCGCILLLVAAMLGFVVYRMGHPSDMVKVRIQGLPADAQRWFVAADEGESVALLEIYDWGYIPIEHYFARPQDGRDFSMSPVFCADAGTRWKVARRYAVLASDVRGNWHRWWIPSGDIRNEPPTTHEPLAGIRVLVIASGATSDTPTPVELDDLGIPWSARGVASDVLRPNVLPRVDEIHSFLSQFGLLANELREAEDALNDSRHVDRIQPGLICLNVDGFDNDFRPMRSCFHASRLCLMVIPVVESFPLATPGQRAAAIELRDSYEEYVRVLTVDQVAAKAMLVKWRALLARMAVP